MNSFPYDSWEEALEAGTGYFTFGPGQNFASVLIALIAIVISVYSIVTVTRRENDLFNESAERLSGKYNGEEG
ncbi:MAG: hypothetical protein KTU85_06795 [Acidimicrobiia bacterium]|nr:hypothetical protein [Acidimicrobiia bacterium]MCY4457161.1 hypothetical protein [Acidimicrobiaceae bacterium]